MKKLTSDVFESALAPSAWVDYLKQNGLSEIDKKKLEDLYTVDLENNIYICDHGAIFSAVDARNASQEALNDWFINQKNDCRDFSFGPKKAIDKSEYNLKLVSGEFPFVIHRDDVAHIVWSSHLVVISNYKELLDKKAKEEQAEFDLVVKGFSHGESSSNLLGAISANSFIPMLVFLDDHQIDCDVRNLSDLVQKDEFSVESGLDFFTNENGAVLNAFDFSGLSDSAKDAAKETIIQKYSAKYPHYELSLKAGQFPMGCQATRRLHDNSEDVSMSSHVLYVKNYQKHLVSGTEKNGFGK